MTHENPSGVFVDYPVPPPGSVRNKRQRRKVMKKVYGDSWWIDLDRLDLEVEALLDHDPSQAERFFLNRAHAGESLAFDDARWARLADPRHVVADQAQIVIGVRGERFADALAVIATEISSGFQWPLGIWERPKNADDYYEHPRREIEGSIDEAFGIYRVWRCYVDLVLMPHVGDPLAGRHSAKTVMPWDTSRSKYPALAVRAYRQAMTAGELSHDGDLAYRRHIGNARKKPVNAKDDEGRPMWTLQKEHPSSPLLIDAAWAGVLSWEARGDAIAAGVLDQRVPALHRRRSVGPTGPGARIRVLRRPLDL